MRVKIFSISFLLVFSLTSTIGLSQIVEPMNGAPPPCQPWPECNDEEPARAPITGSIILLLAGGFGLGIKAVSKKRKKH